MYYKITVNGHEIKDIIDLLCVLPPDSFIHKGEKEYAILSDYINWSMERKNCWVQANIKSEESIILDVSYNIHRNRGDVSLGLDQKDAIYNLLTKIIEWNLHAHRFANIHVTIEEV